MRIGVIGPMGPDLFAENLVLTLRAMGHSCIPVGSASPRARFKGAAILADIALRSDTVERAYQSKLVDKVREEQIEIVITVESTLLPHTVGAMRRSGAKVALWFPDALANLDRQLMFLSPYDGVFLKDPLLVDRVRNLLGLPVHYLPEACNPMWHRPTPRDHVEPFLVIAGNMYPSRVVLLNRLVAAGVALRLYGASFSQRIPSTELVDRHAGETITTHRKALVYRTAAGVLNNLHPSELTGVNCRLFEAAGSGAAVLCEKRPALADLFETDSEVLAFDTFDELVDQAKKLLHDPDYGTRLGDAASARAHSDHTYQIRLTTLLDSL